MFHYRFPALLLGVLLVLVTGCSSRKPIQAIVTLDGKPVDGASVVLTKTDGGPSISGQTAADGTVTLDSSSKEGVPPGDYKVIVTKGKALTSGVIDPKEAGKMMMKLSKMVKSELPAKYASAATTDLTLKVPSDTVPAKIELKGK